MKVMFSAIYAICCVGILVLFTQCDIPIKKTVVEEQPVLNTEVNRSRSVTNLLVSNPPPIDWRDSVDYYFEEEESDIIIESVDPLTMRISADDDFVIDCSEGGGNQLEMNFCSKAKRVLAARAFRHVYDSLQVVLVEKHKDSPEVLVNRQQDQAQNMFDFLQFLQEAAVTEGEEYEGGSMRPLIENEKATSLFEQYIKDIENFLY